MALAAALFDCVLLSVREGIPLFVTSDTLLPMHMAWDTHRFPGAWAEYQWPRIPSLVPDMAYFHGTERLGIGWREAWLGFIPLQLGLLALAIGAIVARLQRSALAVGSAQAGLALAAWMLVLAGLTAATGLGPWSAPALVLMPVTHGSGLMLSMVAAATADAGLHGNRRAFWATLALCLLGAFSDLLFVIAFLIPLAVATRVPVLQAILAQAGPRGLLGSAIWLRLVTHKSGLLYSATLACLIGWASQRVVNLQPLGTYLLRSPRDALPQMLDDLVHTPWTGLVIAGSLALIATAISKLRPTAGTEAPDHHSATFLIVFGAVAATMGLALLAVTYVDPNSWRYGMTCIWWPLTIGLALRPPVKATEIGSVTRSAPAYAVGGAMLLAAVMLVTVRPPPLLTWHSPLEACVSGARARLGLRHGLAPYWRARSTEASSDWQLQVRPIADDGSGLPWGDDRTLFVRDANAPGAPARFNFVVVDHSTNRTAILKKFGIPVARSPCPDAELWTYDHWLSPV